MSLSDAVQHGNQALLEVARDTLLYQKPALLSRVDTASDTTASTADMTSNASTTSEPKSEQSSSNPNNISSHISSNNSSSSSTGERLTTSPLSIVHSTASWGRVIAGSRVCM